MIISVTPDIPKGNQKVGRPKSKINLEERSSKDLEKEINKTWCLDSCCFQRKLEWPCAWPHLYLEINCNNDDFVLCNIFFIKINFSLYLIFFIFRNRKLEKLLFHFKFEYLKIKSWNGQNDKLNYFLYLHFKQNYFWLFWFIHLDMSERIVLSILNSV